VSICRVPSQEITQAPWDSLPVYVCPFAVRSPWNLLRGFSWQHGIIRFVARGPRHHVSGLNEAADLPTTSPYTLEPGSNTRPDCPSASPHRTNDSKVVQEYSPVSHQLRLSASPKGPTNPERIGLPQETLDLRRAGFTPALSLLVPAGSLPSAPPVLTV
jgi:hypothetical protein